MLQTPTVYAVCERTRLDVLAEKYYIDPFTNPLRVMARAAFKAEQTRPGTIALCRKNIARLSTSPRALSLFDSAISTCEYHERNRQSEVVLNTRIREQRKERKARGRKEWQEAV